MSTLAGTGALAKLAGRRDRVMLPAWIYILTALVAGTAYSFRKLYPTVRGPGAVRGGGGPQSVAAVALRAAVRQLARVTDRLAVRRVSRPWAPG